MPEANPIRPTTPEAIQLAKTLLRTSRYGAVAVFDAATGRPLASRVAVATDTDGTPLILVSGLAAHTPGLLANPACSLLLGEVGKGDPLAHARVTLHCQARKVERTALDYPRIRRRYLNHNPKGSLYVDLGDFAFFRLELESASLNGGFGKAFNLTRDDLLCAASTSANFAENEQDALDDLNENHVQEIARIAQNISKSGGLREQFKIVGIDPEGADIAQGDLVLRHMFSTKPDSLGEAVTALVKR
ncbi:MULTISPECIES: pyridoxamine 5'-phosphate oxidase family protein [unclassified Ochrobactrum]|uniref:HugZ family pyridoxamine 5'-phosphate oxidase n=1 Tax=unclassified Ochrobactrum TaxID=239106 RepID=UPI000DF00FDC|nr:MULTISPECIES: pyridoxamine 5'-phosphate oxidase family protein [unclassified Ochrobactrum]MBQ0708912.1 HugZ family protein [Ochrobactrum sp. AP1BH01-1]